ARRRELGERDGQKADPNGAENEGEGGGEARLAGDEGRDEDDADGRRDVSQRHREGAREANRVPPQFAVILPGLQGGWLAGGHSLPPCLETRTTWVYFFSLYKR